MPEYASAKSISQDPTCKLLYKLGDWNLLSQHIFAARVLAQSIVKDHRSTQVLQLICNLLYQCRDCILVEYAESALFCCEGASAKSIVKDHTHHKYL